MFPSSLDSVFSPENLALISINQTHDAIHCVYSSYARKGASSRNSVKVSALDSELVSPSKMCT